MTRNLMWALKLSLTTAQSDDMYEPSPGALDPAHDNSAEAAMLERRVARVEAMHTRPNGTVDEDAVLHEIRSGTAAARGQSDTALALRLRGQR